MQPRTALRFFAILALGALVAASSPRSVGARPKRAWTQQAAERSGVNPANPKIRAITAFVNLDWRNYQQQIADTLKMLRRAQVTFESRGYQVQTIRIATQPFPQYIQGMNMQQAVDFFKLLDALAEQQKFAMDIGPAMLNADDPASQADTLAEILANTKTLNATLVVAGDDGVRWGAVAGAARVMKKLETSTVHSQGNFRFAAIANVPPLSPFFPAAYHTGFGHQFAIALESANFVAAAFKDAPDLAAARQRLTDALASVAFDVEHHAGRVDSETGWTYMGIDLSPAPSPARLLRRLRHWPRHHSAAGRHHRRSACAHHRGHGQPVREVAQAALRTAPARCRQGLGRNHRVRQPLPRQRHTPAIRPEMSFVQIGNEARPQNAGKRHVCATPRV